MTLGYAAVEMVGRSRKRIRRSKFNRYSLNFDDSDDYAALGSAITYSGGFTISLWVKIDEDTFDDSGYNVITGGTDSYLSIYNLNRLRIKTPDGLTFLGTFDNSATMAYDTWHHLVVARDGLDNCRVYLDGTLVKSASRDGNFVVDKIGKYGSSAFYGGNFDEIGIWDDTLSGREVTALYNSGKTIDLTVAKGDYNSQGDLDHWWRMGDGTESGTGTTVYDMSSNSNNLTLTNGPAMQKDVP